MDVDAIVDIVAEEELEGCDGGGRVDCWWSEVGLADCDEFSWHELNPEFDLFGVSNFVVARICASVRFDYV